MEITKRLEYYLDGGSIGIPTNKGNFFIDRRVNSKTKNKLFNKYPDKLSARIVRNKSTINDLINALKNNLTGEDKEETILALDILRGENNEIPNS